MSERFSADWLTLREAADHAARSEPLLERLRDWSRGRKPLRIVDLGTGTGSNLRYLAPRLGVAQEWTLLDHDADLLVLASAAGGFEGVNVRTVCVDIGNWDPASVGPDLVTASALLDLVADDWLDRLVRSCAGQRAAALLVLTYDGDIGWSLPDPDDDLLRSAVNAHQGRDKGLGAALGPRATAEAATRFRAAGYRIWIQPSPWRLACDSLALAQQLIDGWVNAATEQCPEEATRFRDWGSRRLEDLGGGRTDLHVGHQDLLALPGPRQ